MGLRDDFLALLAPPYEVVPLDDGQTWLITHHDGHPLEPPARLHLLTESLFSRYVARLADRSGERDLQTALGLVFVHLDEAVTADSAAGALSDVGVRRRRIGGPSWFVRRSPNKDVRPSASGVWLAEPPGV